MLSFCSLILCVDIPRCHQVVNEQSAGCLFCGQKKRRRGGVRRRGCTYGLLRTQPTTVSPRHQLRLTDHQPAFFHLSHRFHDLALPCQKAFHAFLIPGLAACQHNAFFPGQLMWCAVEALFLTGVTRKSKGRLHYSEERQQTTSSNQDRRQLMPATTFLIEKRQQTNCKS